MRKGFYSGIPTSRLSIMGSSRAGAYERTGGAEPKGQLVREKSWRKEVGDRELKRERVKRLEKVKIEIGKWNARANRKEFQCIENKLIVKEYCNSE